MCMFVRSSVCRVLTACVSVDSGRPEDGCGLWLSQLEPRDSRGVWLPWVRDDTSWDWISVALQWKAVSCKRAVLLTSMLSASEFCCWCCPDPSGLEVLWGLGHLFLFPSAFTSQFRVFWRHLREVKGSCVCSHGLHLSPGSLKNQSSILHFLLFHRCTRFQWTRFACTTSLKCFLCYTDVYSCTYPVWMASRNITTV